ncbi:MAG TPA: OmpH family outer membrane protein [Giesbergeria sp.]|jgi:outer membrane protein|uniref:OmpH family outer membrane protein n=1 Tax=Comamonadaceae TaxID=80864 RepID=UPI0013899808|nr:MULTISPECIES: OmpH family outer membrane protein [unclassified Acidovorax]MBL8363661.1 OmpH family outer membrane protein [Comamonas sp.]MCL4770961.1 OmpH family outer membrane protein [Burkholderiaceae bacterium]HMZ85433.1 OmpH family outer membrane protein [Giesbergeria sp.]NCU65636.1 OmpH family outer membrane protein [Acidovorax sp. 210-6]HNE71420.1 OmpH family outer membrane protein [Giesbergeria sp.]
MKHLSRQLALVLMLSGVGAAAPAYADFKAGFIHTDRVFREASSAKAAQAKLEQEFSRRDKEINDLGNTLKTATEKFERDAPTLSDSQRQTRQRQLMDQDREFQRKRREFQEDLNARKNEELNQLGERINKVVKQLAEQEKYDIIVDQAVYINPQHDITDKVIKALNGASK